MNLPFSCLVITPKSADFGEVEIGTTRNVEFNLENTGNKASTIFKIINFNKAFSTDQPPLVVPPFSSTLLKASFTPKSIEKAKNLTIILSDAVDLPIRSIRMTGEGVNQPIEDKKTIISIVE